MSFTSHPGQFRSIDLHLYRKKGFDLDDDLFSQISTAKTENIYLQNRFDVLWALLCPSNVLVDRIKITFMSRRETNQEVLLILI